MNSCRFISVQVEDGKAEQIGRSAGMWNARPHFSRDGTALYFTGRREKFAQLYRLPLEPGAAPRAVTRLGRHVHDALVSPDGNWVALRRNSEILVARTGPQPLKDEDFKCLSTEGGRSFAFTPDSSAIVYSSGNRVWRRPLPDGDPVEIAVRLALPRAVAAPLLIRSARVLQARGGDNTAINSKIHRQLGITIDKDKIIDALMKRGEGRLDQNLLNLWADNSGKVMDIIIDLMAAEGMPTYLVIPDRADDETSVIDKWPDPTGFPAGWDYRNERRVEYPTCHRPGGRSEDQRRWLVVIEKNARKNGAQFHYNTRAAQLLRDRPKGRITGVVAQAADGGYLRFSARKAVVLCTGDYGANREMLAKYCPQMPLPSMVKTSMGEGHQMAMWVGAVMENPPHAPMSHLFHVLGTDAFLMVNRFGKRFYNEDSDTESMANQIYEQGGAWVVFDDSWEEDIVHMGPGFKRVFRMTEKVRQEFRDVLAGKSGGPWRRQVLRADTIEELASKMKVPVGTFQETIARYNELAKLKKDLDYGKRADRLTAVDKPPFYAEWIPKPSMSLVVLGGLLVNEKLQALDKDGLPIPGLYLAGNTVGRRFKSGYPLVCPGLSHSMAFTHGYLAGRFAAEEARA